MRELRSRAPFCDLHHGACFQGLTPRQHWLRRSCLYCDPICTPATVVLSEHTHPPAAPHRLAWRCVPPPLSHLLSVEPSKRMLSLEPSLGHSIIFYSCKLQYSSVILHLVPLEVAFADRASFERCLKGCFLCDHSQDQHVHVLLGYPACTPCMLRHCQPCGVSVRRMQQARVPRKARVQPRVALHRALTQMLQLHQSAGKLTGLAMPDCRQRPACTVKGMGRLQLAGRQECRSQS